MDARDDEGKTLLCQCLVAVSLSDGDLDGREIATIVTIVEQATGVVISADDVVNASIELDDWDGFRENVSNQRNQLDFEFRLQILKTSIMVGRADSVMIDSEIERIYHLAEALGFSRVEADEQFKVVK